MLDNHKILPYTSNGYRNFCQVPDWLEHLLQPNNVEYLSVLFASLFKASTFSESVFLMEYCDSFVSAGYARKDRGNILRLWGH